MTAALRTMCWPAALLAAFMLLVGLPGNAQAAPGIDPALAGPLQESLQQIQQGEPGQAIERLQALLGRSGLSTYDRATLLRFLGHGQMQAGAHGPAIEAFEQAIQSGALSRRDRQEVHYQLGQLYLLADLPEQAIAHLRKLDRKAYPRAALYLSQAQERIGDYGPAIEAAEQRLQGQERPERATIDSLLGLYQKAAKPNSALALAKKAISWYPEVKAYWQWQVRLHLQQQQKPEALAVLRAMHRQGMLNEKAGLLRLVDLHLHLDAPLQAAVLIEQALASGRIEAERILRRRLASAWLQAREWQRAEEPLQGLIDEQAEPKLFLDLALAYSKQDKWPQAMESYERALRIGRGEHAGEVWLLLGIAAIKSKAMDRAETALENAEKYPRQREWARKWLVWLEQTNKQP